MPVTPATGRSEDANLVPVDDQLTKVLLGRACGEEITPGRLPALYPWPSERTWVRAMMVTGLDGAAVGPDALSGSISGTADGAVFDAVRTRCDVILAGAQTIRAERYQPVRAENYPADRAAEGLASAPVLVTVSRSLDLPWELPLFTESTQRPLVLTAGAHEPKALELARSHAEVVVLGGDRVAPAALVGELVRRGHRRIVCEGGPTLLNELIAADLVDEADITLSPTFSGTGASPITAVLERVRPFDLVQLLESGGFLMGRYLRMDS